MRKVFIGFSAWVGRIDSAYRCAVWTHKPTDIEFDPTLLIPIDLGRCPEGVAMRRYTWAQVSAQDFAKPDDDTVNSLGRTTIGPSFPTPYMNGALYIEADTLDTLRQHFDIPEPTLYFDGRLYEFETVLEIDDSGLAPHPIQMFHGAHAELVDGGKTVKLFQRARSLETPEALARSFSAADLADPNKVHQELTTLGKDGATSGAVYLEDTFAVSLELNDPKRPTYLG